MFLIQKRGDRIEAGHRIQVLDKAMQILTAFSRAKPEWGVSELARHLGLPKSLVSKVLATLATWDMVVQDPVNRRYRLGHQLLSLATALTHGNDLRQASLPVMQQLVERTEETVKLSVISGDETLVLEAIESPYMMRLTARVGQRNPIYAGASNLILLAHKREEEILRILQDKAPPDHAWRRDPARFMQRLADIRDAGYALSSEEVEEGVLAISAPVRDASGQVIASISILGPVQRLPVSEHPRLVREVCAAAAAISSRLGG